MPAEDGELCTICAVEPLNALDNVAQPDCCTHRFCVGCMQRWTQDFVNKCPLCQQLITRIHVLQSGAVMQVMDLAPRSPPDQPHRARMQATS